MANIGRNTILLPLHGISTDKCQYENVKWL